MELLSEALHIQALEEAYIADGQGYKNIILSENRQLQQKDDLKTPYLLKVEVRAVLDDNDWNSPPEQRYRFLDGRRTWIVRNKLVKKPANGEDPHPALLSSRACEELEGWIERVASAYSTKFLSIRRLSILRPLLAPVSIKNKRDIFELRGNLTPDAIKFLEWYEKWDKDNQIVCSLKKHPSKKERLILAWRNVPCSKLVSTILSVLKG